MMLSPAGQPLVKLEAKVAEAPPVEENGDTGIPFTSMAIGTLARMRPVVVPHSTLTPVAPAAVPLAYIWNGPAGTILRPLTPDTMTAVPLLTEAATRSS